MDNSQIPPVQPTMNGVPPQGGGFGGSPSGVHAVRGGAVSGGAPGQPGMAPNGMPMVQQIKLSPLPQKHVVEIVKTVAIVVLTLVAIVFIGLFIWKEMEYDQLQANWQAETDMAVATAKDEQAMELSKRYNEEKKYPYLTFTGPADYGQLSFEYPKTWSVYVQQSATNGGDFAAYFNPVQVNEVSDQTINALRVTILTQSFDEVVKDYQGFVDHPDAPMTMTSIEIGDAEKGIHQTANRYDGELPGTELQGSIVIFKIRDKTVILQTDSEIFIPEFNKLLGTITFNA